MLRRQFIKGLAAFAGVNTFLSGHPFSLEVNTAKASDAKTLVVVFQRGGCDGLNSVIPYFEERYYQVRPNISVGPPDRNNPLAALDIDGRFGFHPGLTRLNDLYKQGNVAILPSVHYENASRSHFAGQHYIESGQMLEESDGWLNRYMQGSGFSSQFRAAGIGHKLDQSLRGDAMAASLTSIDSFNLGTDEAEQSLLISRMKQVYDPSNSGQPLSATQKMLHRFGSKVMQDIDIIADIRQQQYIPENGAVYPNSVFGRDLQQVAQLIKAGVGLELATVTIGGWDTHINQGGGIYDGTQSGAHRNYAQSLQAFYQDLGTAMNNVVILSQTEFGRTLVENGSMGTDHGYASTWYVMGAGVKGGIYGEWPGLEEDQLHQGRYLQRTVDYRDVYAAILKNHLQHHQLDSILPGHTVNDLGIFS